MVGGGGGKRKILPYVDAGFDHDDFVPDPDDSGDINYLSDRRVITGLDFNQSPSAYNVTRDSVITVEYRKGNNTEAVTIAGMPVGVEFNPKKLRYDHSVKKHRGNNWQLKRLLVSNYAPRNLSMSDEIEVHTEESRRRRKR